MQSLVYGYDFPAKTGLEHVVFVNDAVQIHIFKACVHSLHILVLSGLNHHIYLMDSALTNEVPDRIVHEHDLKGSCEPAADGRDELLGNDQFKYGLELKSYLLLLTRREDINNTVDGIGGTLCMQR